MHTVTRPPGNPEPPPDRITIFREAVDEEAARRGLPPEPWAA